MPTRWPRRSASRAAGAYHQPRPRPTAPHKYFGKTLLPSALSRHTPADFIALLQKHGIPSTKHKGQLFADRSAEDIIAPLLAECAAGGVTHWQPCSVKNSLLPLGQTIQALAATKLILIAARCRRAAWWWRQAGCPFPKSAPPIGATSSHSSSAEGAHRTRPAWCAHLDGDAWAPHAPALRPWRCPCRSARTLKKEPRMALIAAPEGAFALGGPAKENMAFDEDLLSGPGGAANLQLLAGGHAAVHQPCAHGRSFARSAGAGQGCDRAKACQQNWPSGAPAAWPTPGPHKAATGSAPWPKLRTRPGAAGEQLACWEPRPPAPRGYKEGEVTLGGIDTRALSQQTMEMAQLGCISLARW